jgi:hypothetical protein
VSTQADGRVLPPWWVVARDVGLFLFGAWVAYMEVRRPEIRDSVLLFAGGLLGTPAATIAVQSLADAIRSRGGTPGPSSSPPEPPPQLSV